MSSFFDDLVAGDCTSCRVTQDKSAYWHPQLYFKDDVTGEYEEVDPLGGMLAYVSPFRTFSPNPVRSRFQIGIADFSFHYPSIGNLENKDTTAPLVWRPCDAYFIVSYEPYALATNTLLDTTS